MEMILDELGSGLPDAQQFTRVVVRMLAAALLGAMVGIQRERAGKPAGVRTHMLVSMGSALFVVACLEWGMRSDAISRVIQGLVTGIGFLGAGSILKKAEQHEVEGLLGLPRLSHVRPRSRDQRSLVPDCVLDGGAHGSVENNQLRPKSISLSCELRLSPLVRS